MSNINDITKTNDDNPGLNLEEEEVPIIPKLVFIVPYRDRKEHLTFFSVYMKHVLSDYDPKD
jgi:hypothetical protein